jgi:hypothetical protein
LFRETGLVLIQPLKLESPSSTASGENRKMVGGGGMRQL